MVQPVSPTNVQPLPNPPSMPPVGMTGPMVWYAFIRELPYIVGILVGGGVAALFLMKAPGSTTEAIVSAVVPLLVSALGRSKPAESETIQRLSGASGFFPLLMLWWRSHHGG